MAEIKSKPDTNDKKATKSKVPINKSVALSTMGRPGERLIDAFDKTERKVDTLSLKDYREMMNDGQVSMLWKSITTIILSAGFKILDDPKWEGEEPSPEKTFIEENLVNPLWKNGLSTPMLLTNRIMLRSYIEGFRIFEGVYRIGDDGLVYLDKLAPRAGDDREVLVLVDDVGEFEGFKQTITFANESIEVEVRNTSPLLKAIKSTYGEEFGSLYGRPGLKGAWYHYDKAHKLMFLFNVGSELGITGWVHAKSNMNDEKNEVLSSILSKPHMQSYLITGKDEVEIEVHPRTDAGTMRETREMISVHYSLLAKTMLAQFLDLGSATSNTGSRSLGDSQTGFFKEGLQTMAETIIESTWNPVIAGLIKANFGGDVYPTFKVNEIDDESAANLYAAFMEFAKKGEVPDSIRTEILVEASKEMGIEVNKEEVAQEIEEQKEQDIQNEKDMVAMAKAQSAQGAPPAKPKKTANLSDVDEFVPARPLFPDEENVKFVAIQRKLSEGRVQAELTMRTLLDNQQENIVDSYLSQLNGGKRTKVALADTQDMLYSEELEQMALDLMEFGKIGAANELEAKVPVTSNKDKQQLLDSVKLMIADQEARLTLRLQSVINDARVSNIPEQDVEALLNQAYNDFFNKALAPTLSLLMPKALNWGRRLAFEANKSIIWGYRYSAVLDANTTNYCRKLDGKILQETDPDYYMLQPPNHFGCRSVYTTITNEKQELYGYKSDGKPDGVPVYADAGSFKDVRLSDAMETEVKRMLGLEK